ncbi:hypothetical protein ACVJMZ_000179 [Sinorhizobium medicae]
MTPIAPELGGSRSGGAIAFPCLSSRPGSGTKVARMIFCVAEQFGIQVPQPVNGARV